MAIFVGQQPPGLTSTNTISLICFAGLFCVVFLKGINTLDLISIGVLLSALCYNTVSLRSASLFRMFLKTVDVS